MIILGRLYLVLCLFARLRFDFRAILDLVAKRESWMLEEFHVGGFNHDFCVETALETFQLLNAAAFY